MNHIKQVVSSWVYYTGALYIADIVFRFVLPPDPYARSWWSPLVGGLVIALAERFIPMSRTWFGRNKDTA